MKHNIIAFFLFFFVSFVGILVFLRFTGQSEDSRHIKAEVEGISGFQLPRTTTKYVQIPGKYEEIELEISLRNTEKKRNANVAYGESQLLISPQDVVVEGIDFTYDERNFLHLKDVKIHEGNRMKIYIPSGTVVSRTGYALENDFIISEVQFVASPAETWGYVKKPLLQYALWSAAISIAVLLLMLLCNKLFSRSQHKLEFDKGVINMAVCIAASVIIMVLTGFLGQMDGTYKSEILFVLFMSLYLVPLGTLIAYKLLMTLKHNIQAVGVIGGIMMLFLQFAATFTVMYVVSVIAGGSLMATTAYIKKEIN